MCCNLLVLHPPYQSHGQILFWMAEKAEGSFRRSSYAFQTVSSYTFCFSNLSQTAVLLPQILL
ncbi:hypothetical protein I7I48_02702 [Histoplasma ohiense]|nr:hypothetical protein I7I48_02702 [Histoplasma ohiense (nom. inval.)]